MTDFISATYLVQGDVANAREAARKIAYEQTVELPPDLVAQPEFIDPEILAQVLGEVVAVNPAPPGISGHCAELRFPLEQFNAQLPAILNLIFGNASLLAGTRLIDFRLPQSLLDQFAGPAFGVEGLRELTGTRSRPLLASAIKPRGQPIEMQAQLAKSFALGGGDILKDDQNIATDFESFKYRVEQCQRAVEEAAQISAKRCLYLPHASVPLFDLERCFEFAAARGIAGLLVCPMILGLETVRALAERYPLVLMAHPAMANVAGGGATHGIAPELLLGTLFRLAGADISIFPHAGGRFPYSLEDCQHIAQRLAQPLQRASRGALRSSYPAPAGGMQLDSIPELCRVYGRDSVLLVGGALFQQSQDVRVGTERFLEKIVEASSEMNWETTLSGVDASASPEATQVAGTASYRLQAGSDFNWSARQSSPYKDAEDAAFKGVRRVELVGKFGELTRNDLRYFEVEPGGYSSLEKHVHGHIVIGARGTGVLVVDGQREPLEKNDVGFIQPLSVHQLRNETDQPFGFFCIVDHRRDRPIS